MPVAEHVNTTGTVAFSDNTLQHRAQCDQFDHTGVETAYDLSVLGPVQMSTSFSQAVEYLRFACCSRSGHK